MQGSKSIPTLLAGIALVTCSVALSAGTLLAEPADWKIDPDHFSVVFEVDHIGYQRQIGLFRDARGNFRYDPETRELIRGRVEVEAASVFTDHDERDEHVRSEDFLHASKHPRIIFEATGFNAEDGDSGTLTGDLTLLGRTRPVALDVTINKRADYPFGHGKETLGISARTTIARSRWGMDYAVSNDLVGDEVGLRFEFEAIRQ